MPLASKIRYSYVIVILPILVFMGICVVTLVSQNRRYYEIIDAAGKASEFSLDFKKDFDYETYLVIGTGIAIARISVLHIMNKLRNNNNLFLYLCDKTIDAINIEYI